MPTQILLPDSITGVFKDGWNVSSGTKVDAVTDKSDSTYVWRITVNERQDFTMEEMLDHGWTINRVRRINQVDVHFRAARTAATGTVTVGIGDHAGAYCDAASQALTGTPTDYSRTNVGNPFAGCGAWTYTDLDTADFTMYPTITNEVRVYDLYAVVDFELHAGGFALWLSSLLPPIMAVASHAVSAKEIAQILSYRSNRPSNSEDFARIAEALRVRPIYNI